MTINPETGTVYSRAELLTAFNLVANPENWKKPIRAYVDHADLVCIREAVIFFTGSVPTFKAVDGMTTLVTADGYYRTIGA